MLETLNNSRFECFVRTFSLTLHHTHRQCFFVESFNLFLLFIPWSFCMLPFIFASFLNNVRIYLPCIQLRVNPYPFRCFNNAKTLDLCFFSAPLCILYVFAMCKNIQCYSNKFSPDFFTSADMDIETKNHTERKVAFEIFA